MKIYDPKDWYWVTKDDMSQAWSSATKEYVSSWPEDEATLVSNRDDLIAALERAGCPDRAPLNANQVRAECQHRIMALMGARDLTHCMIKQLNASMRANQLNDKQARGEVLTEQETAEATALRALAAEVQRLRAKSNEMEPNPPADYNNDTRWVA